MSPEARLRRAVDELEACRRAHDACQRAWAARWLGPEHRGELRAHRRFYAAAKALDAARQKLKAARAAATAAGWTGAPRPDWCNTPGCLACEVSGGYCGG